MYLFLSYNTERVKTLTTRGKKAWCPRFTLMCERLNVGHILFQIQKLVQSTVLQVQEKGT